MEMRLIRYQNLANLDFELNLKFDEEVEARKGSKQSLLQRINYLPNHLARYGQYAFRTSYRRGNREKSLRHIRSSSKIMSVRHKKNSRKPEKSKKPKSFQSYFDDIINVGLTHHGIGARRNIDERRAETDSQVKRVHHIFIRILRQTILIEIRVSTQSSISIRRKNAVKTDDFHTFFACIEIRISYFITPLFIMFFTVILTEK